MSAPRVLFICPEPVGERPLGVAIRTLELAKVLSAHADVTIAAVAPSTAVAGAPAVVDYQLFGSPRRSGRGEQVAQADAVVALPPWPHLAALLRRAPARVVYDLY